MLKTSLLDYFNASVSNCCMIFLELWSCACDLCRVIFKETKASLKVFKKNFVMDIHTAYVN